MAPAIQQCEFEVSIREAVRERHLLEQSNDMQYLESQDDQSVELGEDLHIGELK